MILFAACSDLKKTNTSAAANNDIETKVSNINLPSEIIIYKDGKKNNILKNGKNYTEMVSSIDKSLCGNLKLIQLVITKDNMDKLKKTETIIEFKYQEQQRKLSNLNFYYTGLIFPLSGDYDGYCFLKQGSNDYTAPINGLSISKNLSDIFK